MLGGARPQVRKTRAAVVVAALVAILVGCSSGSGSDSSPESGGTIEAPNAEAPTEGRSEGAAGPTDAQTGPTAPGQLPPASDRKIVRNARMELEVAKIRAAAERIRDLGTRYGGFVADENITDEQSSLTLKVESARMDAALDELTALGTVRVRSQQAEDITQQAVDLEVRLANQRASVARVRTLLDQAATLEEIVEIEAELTDRQSTLESLERRSSALDAQAQLATIEIELVPREPQPAAGPPGFVSGLRAGWSALAAVGGAALTGLGAVLPFVAAVAIPLAVVFGALRLWRRPKAPIEAVAGGGAAGSAAAEGGAARQPGNSRPEDASG